MQDFILMTPFLTNLSLFDLLAVAMSVVLWWGTGWIIEHPPVGKPSVSVLMKNFRREWMEEFVTRNPRIFDGNILSTLREGTAFFASACMIAIGGLLALMGNSERLAGIAQELELTANITTAWAMKLLIPMFYVVNAFLKFVWAHRLFGYCAVVMAAVPNDLDHPKIWEKARLAAEVNITAARNFNAGLRSVYFALAGLGWLAGAQGLFLMTVLVTYVSWQREFASESRQIIMGNLGKK